MISEIPFSSSEEPPNSPNMDPPPLINVKLGDRISITLLLNPPETEKIIIFDSNTDQCNPGSQLDGYTLISNKTPLALFALGHQINYTGEIKLPAEKIRAIITEIVPSPS